MFNDDSNNKIELLTDEKKYLLKNFFNKSRLEDLSWMKRVINGVIYRITNPNRHNYDQQKAQFDSLFKDNGNE